MKPERYQLLESLTALLEARELVERRARRGQQDHVAGLREADRGVDARHEALDILVRDLLEEARGREGLRLAVDRALARVRQVELALRARDADVAGAALFLDLIGVHERARMREEALLHADHEDNGELEALGRVQRHERHAVVLDVGVVDVGDERELREEGLEVRVLLRLLEVARDADEFLEILDARLVLRLLVGFELREVARVLEHLVDEIVELHVHVGVHEVEDE